MASISYNKSREITELKIVDSAGKIVFAWKEESQRERKTMDLSERQKDCLEAELKRTGVEMEAVQERYHIENPKQMSSEIYDKVMAALAKTKSLGAA